MFAKAKKIVRSAGEMASNFVSNHKNLCAAGVGGALMVGGSASSWAADALVTLNSTTGMPEFHAEVVFSPMITAVIGIVVAATALWITLAGVGFIKRFMHG